MLLRRERTVVALGLSDLGMSWSLELPTEPTWTGVAAGSLLVIDDDSLDGYRPAPLTVSSQARRPCAAIRRPITHGSRTASGRPGGRARADGASAAVARVRRPVRLEEMPLLGSATDQELELWARYWVMRDVVAQLAVTHGRQRQAHQPDDHRCGR